MNVLAQAQINAAINLIVVEPGEIVKYYDSNKQKYTQVRVKAIYIAFADAAPAGAAGNVTHTRVSGRPHPWRRPSSARYHRLMQLMPIADPS